MRDWVQTAVAKVCQIVAEVKLKAGRKGKTTETLGRERLGSG